MLFKSMRLSKPKKTSILLWSLLMEVNFLNWLSKIKGLKKKLQVNTFKN